MSPTSAIAAKPTPIPRSLPTSPPPSLASTPPISPTQPVDPPRSTSTDLSWPRGDVFVDGTLTIPAGAATGAALPAVLLVADGGGADRDWVSPSSPGINGSGRLLAAAIAAEGYITLRYDSRGTGRRSAQTTPLPGENRLDDSVGEVASAIEFLATRPEVDRKRIFLLAHDEGALYVLLHEQKSFELGGEPAVAGMALLAPSGLTLRQQVIRRLGELTTGPEDEPLLARFDAAMAFFVDDIEPGGEFGLTPSLQALFDSLSHPLNRPYISEVWNLEIVPLLPETAPPVLVLIGQADSELDWVVDGGMWEDAAAPGQDVRFAYPAHADHVLKSVSSGDGSRNSDDAETGLATYNVSGRTLDGETVEILLNWLNDRSSLTTP